MSRRCVRSVAMSAGVAAGVSLWIVGFASLALAQDAEPPQQSQESAQAQAAQSGQQGQSQPESQATGDEADADSVPGKLYELRMYTAAEGKLPELHARFREHTMRLFDKHGMENIIYWTVSEGTDDDDAENMLVYLLAHDDREAAQASWEAFRNDPEWQEVVRQSEANGPLLAGRPRSIYMEPTDFNPAMQPANAESDAPARLFELRQYNTGEAGLPSTVERFREGEGELFRKHGMETVAFWTAADDSAFIYLLAHKDRETSRESWQGFFGDFRQFMSDFNARRQTQGDGDGEAQSGERRGRRGAAEGGRRGGGRRGGGGGGRGGNEIRFLVPTDYSPRK